MNKNGCYIDLHAHLDGSVTVDIAKKLAALQNIALPADNDKELLTLLSVPDSCESLNDFLQCFDLPGRLMQTPEGLQNAVTLVLENMALDGVIYAELRFAPQFHTLGGMTQEQAVQAAVAGLKNAPIPGNLILCCMRGEGNEKANEETLALAKKYLVRDHPERRTGPLDIIRKMPARHMDTALGNTCQLQHRCPSGFHRQFPPGAGAALCTLYPG